MQGKLSRAGLTAGLQPERWVCLFEKEDPTEDPVFNYRGINLHMHADHLNSANAEYVIQDSVDGTTWVTRLTGPNPIVPGGEVDAVVFFRGKYVRALLFSHGTGRIDATLAIPEDQVIPGLFPVHALACASYCEISTES